MQKGAKLEREVLDAIKSLQHHSIDVGRIPAIGLSGNVWNADIVAAKMMRPERAGGPIVAERYLVMVECKDVKSKNNSTYDNQLKRAYAEFGDLRNIKCFKYVIVPRKRRWKGRHFNYDSYFKSVGVRLIEWSKGKRAFSREVEKIFNDEYYWKNNSPWRKEYKAKWVREHYGKRPAK